MLGLGKKHTKKASKAAELLYPAKAKLSDETTIIYRMVCGVRCVHPCRAHPACSRSNAKETRSNIRQKRRTCRTCICPQWREMSKGYYLEYATYDGDFLIINKLGSANVSRSILFSVRRVLSSFASTTRMPFSVHSVAAVCMARIANAIVHNP